MTNLIMIYRTLFQEYGPQGWWPVNGNYSKGNYSAPRNTREAEEIIIGAILTQNTSWRNVEKALDKLRTRGLLSFKEINNASTQKIAAQIKSAGYYNMKAKKLKAFAGRVAKFGGLPKLFSLETKKLRKELLGIYGVGPETADSILLYAAKKPSFVVDAYTRRIFSRIGLLQGHDKYDEIKSFFQKNLKSDLKLYNEFHALIVEHAKQYCGAKPRCEECPLNKKCSYGKKWLS